MKNNPMKESKVIEKYDELIVPDSGQELSSENLSELTQEDIGEKIGWGNTQVSNYNNLNKISTQVLELAKQHQKGRVKSDSTNVNFTEGWFRNNERIQADLKPLNIVGI